MLGQHDLTGGSRVGNLACFRGQRARQGDGRLRPLLLYVLGYLASGRRYPLLVDVLQCLLEFAEVADVAATVFIVRGIRRSRDRT